MPPVRKFGFVDQRNYDILKLLANGHSYAVAAKAHSLSASRAQQIFIKTMRMLPYRYHGLLLLQLPKSMVCWIPDDPMYLGHYKLIYRPTKDDLCFYKDIFLQILIETSSNQINP